MSTGSWEGLWVYVHLILGGTVGICPPDLGRDCGYMSTCSWEGLWVYVHLLLGGTVGICPPALGKDYDCG